MVPMTADAASASGDAAVFDRLVTARRTNLRVDPDKPVPVDVVRHLCTLATWAPNHKRTEPWRFASCTGQARARLGEAFAADLVASGRPADDPKVAKTRTKYLRAPVALVVGSAFHEDPFRRIEDRDAVAAGIQNLLLGATAYGLASYWSSPPLDSGAVKQLCGFDAGVQLVAVIYLGWPIGDVPVPERAPLALTELG